MVGGGKLIALRAAENYRLINKHLDEINKLPEEIISYYKKLYKSYNDRILTEILENKTNFLKSTKINMKVFFLYIKYKAVKYIYKKFYKLKNMFNIK